MDRKKMYVGLGAAIVIIFAVLVYLNTSGRSPSSNVTAYIGKRVPQALISELNVPSSISNKIVEGTVGQFPTSVSAPPLNNGTKPEVLYIGAEYCPYCAVTRWGLIIALMRFGTFSNLRYMASSSSDVYPNTPTFTFFNSTYSSNYISFVSVETSTSVYPYQPLQNMPPFQGAIFSKYNPGGGIPFIDFGNISIQDGAPFMPQVLAGYDWNSIAGSLGSINSSVAQSVVGSADVFTAEICRMTNSTPSNVCSQPYVTYALRAMGASGA